MDDDGLFFGPCLNPGGDVPAPLTLSNEARAEIARQIGGFMPGGPIAGRDWPAPTSGLTLADLAATMERLAPVARLLRRELHCHADVTEAMKRHAESVTGREVPGGITGVFGIPVIVSDQFGPGEWELRADGNVVSSGHVDAPYLARRIKIEFRDPEPFSMLRHLRGW